MELHRQVEAAYRGGTVPSAGVIEERLCRLVDKVLFQKRLNPAMPAVGGRLTALRPGLGATAELIARDMASWAVDPERGYLLVWAENSLDHGPNIRAVQLAGGYLVRTRPDIIGIRKAASGSLRVVVRDYKAKGQPVDPAYDTGILIRALWALAELRDPRCRWFLAGRSVTVDVAVVDLETVNLMHASDGFLSTASLTEAELVAHRDHFLLQMDEMAELLVADDASWVPASPGPFCQHWCPFLVKCEPGMEYVRKYVGEEDLALRLASARG